MTLTLAIDAAASVATVAVLEGSRLLADGVSPMKDAKAERLLPLVIDVLTRAGGSPADVGQIVCGGGPGSFTSLRIAAATAKGFIAGAALAQGPVVTMASVSSLLLIVAGAAERRPAGHVLAVLDAMRGDRFVQHCEVLGDGRVVAREAPVRISASALETMAQAHGAVRIGPVEPGSDVPHARGVARLLPEAFTTVDVAHWEPDYGRLPEAQVLWEAAHGQPLVGRPLQGSA
jgi:tRNA threonylcarbamoyladenosine biosynthesis protein TsaB